RPPPCFSALSFGTPAPSTVPLKQRLNLCAEKRRKERGRSGETLKTRPGKGAGSAGPGRLLQGDVLDDPAGLPGQRTGDEVPEPRHEAGRPQRLAAHPQPRPTVGEEPAGADPGGALALLGHRPPPLLVAAQPLLDRAGAGQLLAEHEGPADAERGALAGEERDRVAGVADQYGAAPAPPVLLDLGVLVVVDLLRRRAQLQGARGHPAQPRVDAAQLGPRVLGQ